MSPTEDSQKGGGEAGVIYGVLEGKGGRGGGGGSPRIFPKLSVLSYLGQSNGAGWD